MEIPFGIRFNPKVPKKLAGYISTEVNHFVELADGLCDKELEKDYIEFIGEFLAGKYKPSTMVRRDLLEIFWGDLDNRAQIDFREDHYSDHEQYMGASIVEGGEYLHKIAGKLKAHLHKFQ